MITIQAALLIIIGILLFELIILSHEFGHFICAKKSGVLVHEFALGMGPKLWGFQKGETLYSLRLLPVGGFCKMEGEDQESDSPRAFGNAKVWQKMLIVVAGAVMNVLLGLLLMCILVVQEPYYTTTTIESFHENSRSATQGLQVGDKIVSFDGYKINTSRDFSYSLGTMKTYSPNIKVERNGEIVDLGNVTFDTTTDSSGRTYISLDFYVEPIERSFTSVISQTFKQTYSVVRMIWASLIGLVTGQFTMNDVSGPIGAASAITEATSMGLEMGFVNGLNNLLFMLMVISVNLGIFNMLPVPALDGGRFFFLLIEAIRRKPIPPKYEGLIHTIGFIILIVFMIFVSLNDVVRLFNGTGFAG
ncbi:MAG: M50 family metallopeptidase [Acutalibacteraceae bacterium]|nr:M50 family metallopeptidase [Acutalibacteraceae bacterium]